MKENRITRILDGATHRERFLRILNKNGVRKYPAESVGTSIDAFTCENGVVIEQLAPHKYNLFMTTIDNDKIVMFMHACVDEHGAVEGRYKYNAFGLGIRSSTEQEYIDEILDSIVECEEEAEVIDYWDLVNREPVPHVSCTANECLVCAIRECPFEEPLHLHHDGCPTCSPV